VIDLLFMVAIDALRRRRMGVWTAMAPCSRV